MVIVVVAAVGSAGMAVVSGVRENAREQKLESDVANLNNALQVYRMSGGTLSDLPSGGGSSTVKAVLAKLQTVADSDSRAKTIGMRGSFVDRRVQASDTIPQAGDLQAVWDSGNQVFTTTRTGTTGVREFVFNEEVAGAAPETESRQPSLEGATAGNWVWDFNNRDLVAERTGQEPTVGNGTGSATAGTNPAAQVLEAPEITPPGAPFDLDEFDVNVQISNPNDPGSSEIYYSVNGGNFLRYTGSFQVPPNASVTAIAITNDPTRFSNSPASAETYTANPVMLAVSASGPSSVTYAQAGGAMKGQPAQTPAQVVFTVTNNDIPARFLSSSNFQIFYTTDGTDPRTSGTAAAGPAFNGSIPSAPFSLALPNWGSATTLNLRAAARSLSPFFTTSAVTSRTVSATLTVLASPSISPASQTVSGTVQVTIADGGTYPEGSEIRYTTNGTDPGATLATASGSSYSGPFSSGAATISARAYGPSGYPNWFTPSSPATVTYQPNLVVGIGESVPAGVLVAFAELQNNVQVNGSVTIARQATQQNITFFGNSRIRGNLYLPGTPKVYKSHVAESQWDNQLWSPSNDPNFSNYILGLEFTSMGQLVTPQSAGWSPSPRVRDMNGDPEPTNYRILIQDSAKVEGIVYRRASPPSLRPVTAPPPKANNNSASFNSWTLSPSNPNRLSPIVNPNPPTNNPASLSLTTNATLTLRPGNYGSVVGSNGGKIVLGDATNPENVQYYSFEELRVNGGASVEIVGKVVITMNYSARNQTLRVDNNGSFGNPNHPEYLQLNVYSSAAPNQNTQQVLIASSSKFYGQINAPTGLVTVQENTVFKGSISAFKLQMTGAAGVGIDFNLPPISVGN